MIKTFRCENGNKRAVGITGSIREIEIDLLAIGHALQVIGKDDEKAMKRLVDSFKRGLTADKEEIEAAEMEAITKDRIDVLADMLKNPDKLEDFMKFMEKEGRKHVS